MTKEEKIDAFTMRLDGYTLQEIGDKYGLTKERIRQILEKSCKIERNTMKNYVYPNLEDWMSKNGINCTMLGKQLNVSRQSIYNILTGKNHPSFELINRVLDVTKMPYEVVFSKDRMELEK